jgi:two-component system, chemotaxis family, response regulator WspF
MNVAIVNDSKIAVEVLRRIVSTLPDFTIAWMASSGDEALRMAAQQRPDIVLMDLIMPGMDGAETTRRMMQTTPCVVLVVTATTVGNRDKVFEAMGHGALDAVNTPTLDMDGNMAGAEPLIQKLRMVARLVRAPQRHALASGERRVAAAHHGSALPIVAIGSSTGGPQALAEILPHLPPHFPAAVLVAQHVDEQFAPGLAAWLQRHSSLPVRIAQAGEPLKAATVWIAGSNDHMVYQEAGAGAPNGSLTYTPDPKETAYRPSVDALFGSLVDSGDALRVGVLLTGMGRDGAEGLLALRKAGAVTMAQDAATCVVYGMPKAAADLQAAAEILPLPAIGPRIRNAVMNGLAARARPKGNR